MQRSRLLLALVALLPVLAGTGPLSPVSAGPGTVRRYYIAADQVRWDYTPADKNLITGKAFGDEENVFVENGPDRIGSTYLKSQFREYTDATFAHLKPRPAEWEHLGDLGPVIRAEVGDTIEVVVDDENASLWAGRNIAAFPGDPKSVKPDNDDFIESNLMHSINGYVYGNLPGLTMQVGQKVRWYVMAMGTEVDLHTPHWHGNTVTWVGMRTDVVSLMPAQMVVADMVPDGPGVWQYHCHVADHIAAGMQALYTVR